MYSLYYWLRVIVSIQRRDSDAKKLIAKGYICRNKNPLKSVEYYFHLLTGILKNLIVISIVENIYVQRGITLSFATKLKRWKVKVIYYAVT